MGVSTTAKRGDARSTSSRPSHVQREVIGVLLITVGLLILLSLLSFVPSDTKLLTSSGPAAAAPAKNMIGTVGAMLAATMFFLIGGAAYLFPLLLGLLGARCFTQTPLTVRLRNAGSSVAAVIFLSAFLHVEITGVPTLSSGMVNRGMAGGIIGQTLAETLRAYFANTGAHIIILAGFLVALLFTVPVSVGVLLQRVPEWWDRVRERMAALIPEWPVPSASEPKRTRQKPAKPARPALTEAKAETALDVVEPEPPALEPAEDLPRIQPSIRIEKRRPPEPSPEPDVVMAHPVSKAGYILPEPNELLSDPSGPLSRLTEEELKAQSEILTKALKSFAVDGRVTDVRPGPVVTMYEYEPAPGTKVARIVNLADDLALALKAISLRIVAPLPGKSVVGIEVPNPHRETVSFKEIVMSDSFARSRSKLALGLGKDIFGAPVTADLKTMPHLLVAGATGAGKSVSLNTMLLSILFNARPDEVKLLLIDPKMLEFQTYEGIPHLLRPVITDPKSAARGLAWVVQEMERRYKLLAEAGVRNIDAYNRKVGHAQGVLPDPSKPEQPELPIQFLSEEDRLSAGETTEGPSITVPGGSAPPTPPEPLPYIVVMIDELADLMMVAPKDVEDRIARLAQMARASGIHLILATQRPSVDV